MPTRFIIVTILTFWLVSMAWLVKREIVPLYRTGEPPAFFTDVIDEVGGTRISWVILHQEKIIGTGFSNVKRHPDRTFELTSELVFKDFPFLNIGKIRKITSRFRIDKLGDLKELATEVRMSLPPAGEWSGEVKGVVEDGKLKSRVYLNYVETDLGPFTPQPVPVPAHGNVLNTMHMLNKIPGLRVGRSWQVPLLDPLGIIFPGKSLTPTELIAEVQEDDLEWQGEKISCFRIDYREPGKKATAHTWVRRDDGLVLQQEARHNDMDLVLVREVNK